MASPYLLPLVLIESLSLIGRFKRAPDLQAIFGLLLRMRILQLGKFIDGSYFNLLGEGESFLSEGIPYTLFVEKMLSKRKLK